MKMMNDLDIDYSLDETEPFMCERHVAYFQNKLLNWKHSIIEDSRDTIEGMQAVAGNTPDMNDRASAETDRSIELRTRDRQRKLVSKIDSALRRLDNGEYGYCEITGDPISLKRLDARPIATLSLEAQEQHERTEKVYRHD